MLPTPGSEQLEFNGLLPPWEGAEDPVNSGPSPQLSRREFVEPRTDLTFTLSSVSSFSLSGQR